MHILLNLTFVCIAALFTACTDVGEAPRARSAAARPVSATIENALQVDTSRSKIGWRAAKVTRTHNGGFSLFDGQLALGRDSEVMGLAVEIDTRSIWSDTEKLTQHLKDEDFFHVERFPVATFRSGEIQAVDSSGYTHLITGNLAMNGYERSITFPATVRTESERARVIGDFIIDRRDWGITYPGKPDDLIRNDVRVYFDVQAASPGVSP